MVSASTRARTENISRNSTRVCGSRRASWCALRALCRRRESRWPGGLLVRQDGRMQKSAATRLLAALDPLDFPARMRLLAQETRQFVDEGGLDAVLDAFAQGDRHLRQLALTMAKISRRTDRLIAALGDPLYRIRVQALFACARIPGERAEAAILASLDDASLAWRRDLARAVSAAKRTDLADRLVESHRARLGEVDAARLLPSCSAEVAARMLPGLVHLVPNWT
jgi:hypothetical protein